MSQTVVTIVIVIGIVYIVTRMFTSLEDWLTIRRQVIKDSQFKKSYTSKQKEIEDAKKAYEDASRSHRDPQPPSAG